MNIVLQLLLMNTKSNLICLTPILVSTTYCCLQSSCIVRSYGKTVVMSQLQFTMMYFLARFGWKVELLQI